jgi:TorA maturation chaperone TorD
VSVSASHGAPSEERLRAGTYALLAGLLAAAPNEDMLERLSAIEVREEDGRDNGLAAAWAGLKNAALLVQAESVDDEYVALFIGLGRGELVPYGSWYLTGFLMEKPLGELRRDLARLGYERSEDVHEPEDHAAALCETMAMLITDEAVSLEIQRRFFETHVGSWIERFFRDLEDADNACFYRAVGRLGLEFMALEQRYLAMPV